MQVRSYKIAPRDLKVDRTKRLGNGATGTAYQGTIILNKHEIPAAIKMLITTAKMSVAQKAESERQIKMEQHLFELLGHADNVIKYYGHTEIKGQFAIVMQFANKGDLATILAKVSDTNLLSLTNTRYLITDITKGVSQLHAKDIIHCDLKSPNILVSEDTPGILHAKVTDLGLSKEKKDQRLCCGSPVYLAPETLLNQKQGKKSDVYSTSLIIWEVLAAPHTIQDDVFTANTFDELKTMVVDNASRPPIYNQFPKKVGMWMERGWSQQASNRPTAQEMATAFEALTDNDMQNTYEKKKSI